MNDATPERWLPVPGYEGFYDASDLGRIRSLDRMVRTNGGAMRLSPGQVLAGGTYKDGHKHVTLCREGKRRTFTIHGVIMLTFVGPRPEGLEIRHLNGIPDDNRVVNLAYGTALENAEDRDDRHGRNFQSNKTHCPFNHKYTPENTYVVPTTGVRQCKACRDGERPAPPCTKCDRPAKSNGLCATHDMARRRAALSEEERAEIRRKDAEAARRRRQERKAKGGAADAA